MDLDLKLMQKNLIFRLIMSCTKNSYLDLKVMQKKSDFQADSFQKNLDRIDREYTRPMQPDNLTHHTIIAEGVEPYKTAFLQLHSFRFGFSRISDLSS